jgi:hypothetical protein
MNVVPSKLCVNIANARITTSQMIIAAGRDEPAPLPWEINLPRCDMGSVKSGEALMGAAMAPGLTHEERTAKHDGAVENQDI